MVGLSEKTAGILQENPYRIPALVHVVGVGNLLKRAILLAHKANASSDLPIHPALLSTRSAITTVKLGQSADSRKLGRQCLQLWA